MQGIHIAFMRFIVSGEPYLIPAEDGTLHSGHIVGCEEQLCAVAVDLLILKKKDHITEKLWVELCIQLINDDKSSLTKSEQDNRQGSNQFSCTVGLFREGCDCYSENK